MKNIPRKTKHMIGIGAKFPVSLEETLRHLYVDENLTVQQVADQIGVSYKIAHQWLQQAGIWSHFIDLDERR